MRIEALARVLDLGSDDVEPYGWHKAKLSLGLERRLATRPPGQYVCVTAINPTPLGEGKTVTAIGLAMALCRRGRRAIVTLREPSLGPLFGIKGGGAGGGHATLVPADDINLHFTGDIHAVATATNLLAALVDNHARRGSEPRLDPRTIRCRRALDLCDRGLERIVTGRAWEDPAAERETGFDLAPASEIMAILALADGLPDLRQRLGRMVVGNGPTGELRTAEQLGVAGALAVLLRDAIRPNLVQTCEETPALVHAGPFANIAHGNSSVVADLAAIRLADYVVTECGFGADCGFEKLIHIKAPISGLWPAAAVLVCTVRATKFHSGRFVVRPGQPLPPALLDEDLDALEAGSVNLAAHLDLLARFGIPAVVAINRFPSDTPRELQRLRDLAMRAGAVAVEESTAFTAGGTGALALAAAVERICTERSRDVEQPRSLYPRSATPREKLATIATQVYGAAQIELSALAVQQLAELEHAGYGHLPVCIAKTQYSLSHDPQQVGRPHGFRLPIQEVRVAAGAGFLYALAGSIRTMPGLPSRPAALRLDVNDDGTIRGW
ncbi:MAG: formate--tetrahydrofolate ligase [Pirellulales bacterium]